MKAWQCRGARQCPCLWIQAHGERLASVGDLGTTTEALQSLDQLPSLGHSSRHTRNHFTFVWKQSSFELQLVTGTKLSYFKLKTHEVSSDFWLYFILIFSQDFAFFSLCRSLETWNQITRIFLFTEESLKSSSMILSIEFFVAFLNVKEIWLNKFCACLAFLGKKVCVAFYSKFPNAKLA